MALSVALQGFPIPLGLIITLSAVLAIVTTLVYKYATDQNMMKELRTELKKHTDQMKEHKDDTQKMLESQKRAMDINMKIMKQNFKPMLITLVPFIGVFWGLRYLFDELTVIPLSFHIPLSGLATGLGWIGTYLIFSMVFTTLFRKALKVV